MYKILSQYSKIHEDKEPTRISSETVTAFAGVCLRISTAVLSGFDTKAGILSKTGGKYGQLRIL